MIKGDVVKKAQKALHVYDVMRANPQLSATWIKQMHEIHPLKTPAQIVEILQDEEAGWNDMYHIASKSKTVLFSGKQAEIFMGIAENYTSPLEYLLPFEYTIIEFTW